MKIALVTKPDKQMTGLLRYALSIYDALRARGVDVALLHPRVPGAMARLGRVLNLDAEAVFSSYPLSAHLPGASICHLASQTLATLLLFQRLPRTVVTVHDIIPYWVRDHKALSTYRNAFERLADRLALRALRRADALIAISNFTKSCIIEALDYPAERIHVIHRAVDREVFRPLSVPPAFRQKYGLDKDQRYVLYVGSEDPRKNLETLIKAFAAVQERLPAARWIKAGSAYFAAEREKLLAWVAELGLEGKVRFLDQVPDEDLPLLYNAVEVFVLPSFYEGFGLPALEAMSCGTPVIASNRASLPEVVGEGGVLVDPQDEQEMAQRIVELIAKPERRAAASQAALQQADRFSLERQASETVGVYKEARSHQSDAC